MQYTVVKKEELKNVRGQDYKKVLYFIKDSKNENNISYCALYWNNLNKPIVYDYEFHEEISKYSWYCANNGYAYKTESKYMHSLITDLAKLKTNTNASNMTIDHINCYKLDNRKRNLRLATQSEQNSNRASRCDKLPPSEELQTAGVKELPRHVRWDKSEQKFIIEKHPQLIKEVDAGLRSKAIMSGSKSKTLTITQKYQDILARLENLDNEFANINTEEFKQLKAQLTQEYESICNCIDLYEGNITQEEIIQPPPEPVAEPIEAKKRTCAGKKTLTKLPENCGVQHEEIPKYCYYKPATGPRGDCFTIDKHPSLLAQDKRQWSTTSSAAKTTREKFNMLMEKYNELEKFKV